MFCQLLHLGWPSLSRTIVPNRSISPSMFLLEFRNLWQRLPGSTFQAALLAIGGIVGRRAEMLGWLAARTYVDTVLRGILRWVVFIMLSGDGVAPVLTNWGQLFVRRRRCIGKPYRPVQSICTAVHDEFQLHPTTLNLETLLPGFVSQGNTTFIDCFLSNHDSIRPYCSSAQRFFGERFGRLLFEEKTISPSLVRTWTIIHAEIFGDQQGLGHLCRSTFLSANVHSAADRFPSFCSFVGSFPSFHLIFRILSFHQNVLLFSASSAYFPSRSTMISEVHGASLDHRQWRAELPRDRAILRTLRRSCCTISWCQLSRVAGAFPRVRNPATWGTETAKRRRTRPRIPSPHLGCNASCYYFPWEF